MTSSARAARWSPRATRCERPPVPRAPAQASPVDTPRPRRYGSSANLVLTTGSGVNGYTLDAALGDFILTHPNIRIPPRGKIYSFNEGNSMYFHPPVLAYLDSIKYPPAASGRSPYSARYIGSMVADVHRTLLYGGIFGYPDDKKSKSGKLRLLYEAFPMAFLTEQVRARPALFTLGSRR